MTLIQPPANILKKKAAVLASNSNAAMPNTEDAARKSEAATPSSEAAALSPEMVPTAHDTGANPNEIVELVFILDRSGSMCGLESDTIGGFNSVLDQHKQAQGKAYVTTVLFDHEQITLHDRVDIQSVAHLTNKDYAVRGNTALLDAVGSTINHISNIQRYLPEGYKASKVVCVITTDGMENASTEYTYSRVKQLIKQKQKDNWEFFFLGANIDAAQYADDLGILRENAVSYDADCAGTAVMYEAVACASMDARVGGRSGKRAKAGAWKRCIEEDRASRAQRNDSE